MHLTLVTPHVGRKNVKKYVRTWQMEPLPMAAMAGLTPTSWDVSIQDERIRPIDFDAPTNLVGIATETYTAKRAYEIAAEYRKRGVPVVFGGYHATLVPEEAGQYGDSVVVGFAEDVWTDVLKDAEAGRLKPRYARPANLPMRFSMPRRSVLSREDYLDVSCVETGRGCPFRCEFCTITAATQARYHPRPIDEILEDVSRARKNIFFIDDNIVGNMRHAKDLFRELKGMNVTWFSQGSLNMARDEELLRLMADSGCFGVLIGFESLRKDTLQLMGKQVNINSGEIADGVRRVHDHGIVIYGTFIYGSDTEDRDDWKRTADEAVKLDLFMGAFNPLIPFPGTGLYKQMRKEKRLTDDQWWLDPQFRFNDVPFTPRNATRSEVREACLEARRHFYSWGNILRRLPRGANSSSAKKLGGFVYINAMLRKEIDEKDGLPLGDLPTRPIPIQSMSNVSL